MEETLAKPYRKLLRLTLWKDKRTAFFLNPDHIVAFHASTIEPEKTVVYTSYLEVPFEIVEKPSDIVHLLK